MSAKWADSVLAQRRQRTDEFSTPVEALSVLARRYGPFTLDPCPRGPATKDGLALDWSGHRVFCNPPYSDIGPWLAKAHEADVAVFLIPARTDTAWWHEYVMAADEIVFVRGRLRFPPAGNSAPFPSAVAVFRKP